MALPAVAPRTSQSPLTLYADGGTIGGSPGSKGVYYSVRAPGVAKVHQRDTSGRRRFADQAEFMAMIAALRLLVRSCSGGETARVVMDCREVIERVQYNRTPRQARTRALYWQAIALKQRLEERGVHLIFEWRRRDELVQVLGH